MLIKRAAYESSTNYYLAKRRFQCHIALPLFLKYRKHKNLRWLHDL